MGGSGGSGKKTVAMRASILPTAMIASTVAAGVSARTGFLSWKIAP